MNIEHGTDMIDELELLAFVHAIADDLELLAMLHDREPTRETLVALRDCALENAFGLVLTSREAGAALDVMRTVIARLPGDIGQATVDEFAVGYTDVYLRYAYRASPMESVWLTEDGLERQAPMFALRTLYRQFGLKSIDGARRPEDHIVLQLLCAAHLAKRCATLEDFLTLAHFLDEHLLRWVRRFAGQLVGAGAPDFYAALALVTATYLDELRGHLTIITGHERPTLPVSSKNTGERVAITVEGRPYVPGVAPSW